MRVSEEFRECLENLKNLKNAVHLAELAVEKKRMEIHAYICELHPTVWVIYTNLNDNDDSYSRISGLFHTQVAATKEYEGLKEYYIMSNPSFEEKDSTLFTLEELVKSLPGMKILFPQINSPFVRMSRD